MSGTFIRLDRSLLKHRYFDNTNVLKVWLYCLMKASYKRRCHLVGSTTIELQVGQFIFGRDKAASELNMSVQTLRTIIKLFENDKKITIKPTSKFSIITVIDFDSYQITDDGSNQHNNHQITINQPTTNQQLTTNKNVNKVKNNNKGIFLPPSLEEVKAYCQERNRGVNPQKWFDFYQGKGWMVGKNKMKDWKAAVRTWEKDGPELPAQHLPEISDAHKRTLERLKAEGYE